MISDKHTLFIWGMKDPAVKPHHLEKFVSRFSNSSVLKLSSCGHFPKRKNMGRYSNGSVVFCIHSIYPHVVCVCTVHAFSICFRAFMNGKLERFRHQAPCLDLGNRSHKWAILL
ncbi:alpha/beta fold hydrolase [Mariniradius sediminis]|uniref:alpha/beta fold hydrolase n=1 Tax=Mariniradius sediminis TaxID=2909237 RepID=UPI0034E19470